jgi:hypothetical protein
MDWSCGNSKSIANGDRLFLLRQGEEPRGIVGVGYAESEPYRDTHWREEKAKAGRTTMYLSSVRCPAKPGMEIFLTKFWVERYTHFTGFVDSDYFTLTFQRYL